MSNISLIIMWLFVFNISVIQISYNQWLLTVNWYCDLFIVDIKTIHLTADGV